MRHAPELLLVGIKQHLDLLSQIKNSFQQKYQCNSYEDLQKFAQAYVEASSSDIDSEKSPEEMVRQGLRKHVNDYISTALGFMLWQGWRSNRLYLESAVRQVTDAFILDAGGTLPPVETLYEKGPFIQWVDDERYKQPPNFLPRHRAQTARYLEQSSLIPFSLLFREAYECLWWLPSDPYYKKSWEDCFPDPYNQQLHALVPAYHAHTEREAGPIYAGLGTKTWARAAFYKLSKNYRTRLPDAIFPLWRNGRRLAKAIQARVDDFCLDLSPGQLSRVIGSVAERAVKLHIDRIFAENGLAQDLHTETAVSPTDSN